MNSTVDAKTFYKAFSVVQKFTQRSVIPQLEEIKADFFPDRCVLTATDLVQWVCIEMPAQGDTFSLVFKYSKGLMKMCRTLSGPMDINYEAGENDGRVSIQCQKRQSTLRAYLGDSFADSPVVEPDHTYTLDAAKLLGRVSSVSYAADEKSDRAAMRGVRFLEDQMFCLNGYRMAVSIDPSLYPAEPFVLPVQSFKYWETLFPGGTVTLDIGKKYARFTGGDVKQYVRLLEPDWIIPQKVVPTSCQERYLVSPKAFSKELAYLSEFIQNPDRQPAAFTRGKVSVESNAGAFTTEAGFGCDSELEISFNVRYLLDAAKHFEQYERITIEFSSPYTPIVLRADENNYAMVLTTRPSKNQQAA